LEHTQPDHSGQQEHVAADQLTQLLGSGWHPRHWPMVDGCLHGCCLATDPCMPLKLTPIHRSKCLTLACRALSLLCWASGKGVYGRSHQLTLMQRQLLQACQGHWP